MLNDADERWPSQFGLPFAKDAGRFRFFFLEDVFAPEDIGYFWLARKLTWTPLSMGELVQERLIDFLLIHLSQVGGLAPAWKLRP